MTNILLDLNEEELGLVLLLKGKIYKIKTSINNKNNKILREILLEIFNGAVSTIVEETNTTNKAKDNAFNELKLK